MEILKTNFNAFPNSCSFFKSKQEYVPVTGTAFFAHIKQDFFFLSNGTEGYFLADSGKTKRNREEER